MSDNYLLSYQRQGYVGYTKKRPRKKKLICFFIITAIAILALAVIFIFFSEDNLINYVPEDSVVYIHSSQNLEKEYFNLGQELNSLFEFPKELTEKEMSWVLLPSGRRALLLNTNKQPDYLSSELVSKIINDKILVISDSKKVLNLFNPKKQKKLDKSIKNYFYFKFSSSSAVKALVKKEEFLNHFSNYKNLVNNYSFKENIYLSIKSRENKLILSLDSGLKNKKISYSPIIKKLPQDAVIYWRGIKFPDFYKQIGKYIPINILSLGKDDFANLFNYLSGEGEIVIIPKNPDTEKISLNDFSLYNFLLIINPDTNKIEPNKLESLLKPLVNYLYFQEKQGVLPDQTEFSEILIGENDYFTAVDGDIHILGLSDTDFALYYKIINENGDNLLFLSNFKDFSDIFGTSESENKRLADKKYAFYLNLEKISIQDLFLANFREILIKNQKIYGFLK